MWQQSVQTNWNPENLSAVCFRPDNSLSFSSAVHITVYIFIGSQIELKIETAVSQKLNFTPRGRVLNFPIQIWERERERPVRQKICISNTENSHSFSFIIISWALNNLRSLLVRFFSRWKLLLNLSASDSIKFGWQKNWIGIGICEHDLGKTYFVEINLSSVKGSGFEILINWLSEAVAGNSWANFFIREKLEFLGWKMTKAISVRVGRARDQIQDGHAFKMRLQQKTEIDQFDQKFTLTVHSRSDRSSRMFV